MNKKQRSVSRCGKTGKAETVRENVRKGYAAIARSGVSCCGPAKSCCSTSSVTGVAKAIGYSDAELATLPDGANMGLSCGNPGAIAALRRGETVLDLGSGGGFDVFLVAQKVGPRGRAIGVDMTPEMLSKARANAESFQRQTNLDNVDFRLGEIEHLPVADKSIDVVISNCVINLSPDKPQVWREIARVLKPGGRVAISDLALLRPLPAKIRESLEALVGCIAGAALVADTRRMIRAAGLVDAVLLPKPGYVDGLVDLKGSLHRTICRLLPHGRRMGDYVTSLDISARKPRRT